ncbi:DUF1659 domain-containing protein [Ureibacillus acetophenoni]|uniref:Uncharacterized protein DUF1659 n=1 Tax=Ureibacillus acetophenoni TaxID=614649 RepID=A0A285UA50_9BACL|nr:DUF1659 domain-containing protein [Ureibacillus acetophenoni]SOC37191.1 uncharacterized protein DUF1659 [Ureibacillus acetophenoni]
MAVYNFEGATLKVLFETGLDEYGKPVVTTKTYQNIRNNVEVEKIATVTQAIASLSKYQLHQAKKTETNAIEF